VSDELSYFASIAAGAAPTPVPDGAALPARSPWSYKDAAAADMAGV